MKDTLNVYLTGVFFKTRTWDFSRRKKMYAALLNRYILVNYMKVPYKFGCTFREWATIFTGADEGLDYDDDYHRMCCADSPTETPSTDALKDLEELGITVVFPFKE